jgi:cytochrome c1
VTDQMRWITRPLQAAMAAALCVAVNACVERPPLSTVPGGQAERAPAHIRAYGCGSCHTIPGVAGARGLAGPPLTAMADRAYIAGMLPNTPEQMVEWIRNPKAVDERTAMPTLGVSEADARDIAAYLFTLRADSAGRGLRELRR